MGKKRVAAKKNYHLSVMKLNRQGKSGWLLDYYYYYFYSALFLFTHHIESEYFQVYGKKQKNLRHYIQNVI